MKETITLKDVYAISEQKENSKARWTKVGIGFLNKDNSINVILDAMPISGKLQIRDI